MQRCQPDNFAFSQSEHLSIIIEKMRILNNEQLKKFIFQGNNSFSHWPLRQRHQFDKVKSKREITTSINEIIKTLTSKKGHNIGGLYIVYQIHLVGDKESLICRKYYCFSSCLVFSNYKYSPSMKSVCLQPYSKDLKRQSTADT